MKKSLLLCASLVFFLTGCSNTSTPKNTPTQATTQAQMFDMETCLQLRNKVKCELSQHKAELNFVKINANEAAKSYNGMFQVVSGTDEWLKIKSPEDPNNTLKVMNSSADSFISFFWDDKRHSLEELTSRTLTLIKESGITFEPNKLKIEVQPYVEDGVVYWVCFEPTEKTPSYCTYFGAANIAKGSVLLVGMAQNESEKINQVEELIISLDMNADGTCTYGDCDNGYGKMEWVDGQYYFGQFSDGNRQGRGTYVWADGSSYAGEFDVNKRTGQGTFFTSEHKLKYKGNFLDGQYHGSGTFIYNDGTEFRGDFEQGTLNGIAELEWPDDKTVFKGEFKDWDRQGKGTYIYSDGSFENISYEKDKKIEDAEHQQSTAYYTYQRPAVVNITEAEINDFLSKSEQLDKRQDYLGIMSLYSESAIIKTDMELIFYRDNGEVVNQSEVIKENRYQHFLNAMKFSGSIKEYDENYTIDFIEMFTDHAFVTMTTQESGVMTMPDDSAVQLKINTEARVELKIIKENNQLKFIEANLKGTIDTRPY